jgi:hypothetical protein
VPDPGERQIADAGIEGRRRLKTTRYFEEQVLRKRPYIRREWCLEVIAAPLRREVQINGPRSLLGQD